MYTGSVVRLRSFALVLALLVAATPVIGVVCAMDCEQPLATSSPCHDATDPQGGITLRAAPHACNHDHTGVIPALLSSASARDVIGISGATPALTPVLVTFPQAHAATA